MQPFNLGSVDRPFSQGYAGIQTGKVRRIHVATSRLSCLVHRLVKGYYILLVIGQPQDGEPLAPISAVLWSHYKVDGVHLASPLQNAVLGTPFYYSTARLRGQLRSR